MARVNLTAFLIAGLAAACFAQQPRNAAGRGEPEDAAISFRCPGGEPGHQRPEAKLFVGDVTRKARLLPRPEYSREARRAGISGVVRAEVVIDLHSGEVVWAGVGGGHPLLRQAVKDVVCRARFYPTFIIGRPAGVRGFITYRFGARR